jgi:hypothetical protein
MREALENYTPRSFVTSRFTKYYYGDYVEEEGMGGACSMHVREEKCLQNFGPKT